MIALMPARQKCRYKAWFLEGALSLEGLEQIALIFGYPAGAVDGLVVDMDLVLLDLAQQCQGAARRQRVLAGVTRNRYRIKPTHMLSALARLTEVHMA